MKLEVVSLTGAKSNTLTVRPEVFAVDVRPGIVHEVVTSYLHNGRSYTSKQKSRSEVRGGGRKPWRQKGTGRARAGTIRSPLWRSGGVTFAARPEMRKRKVNRKVYRLALQMILTALYQQQRLSVLDALTLTQPKTKALLTLLQPLQLSAPTLLVFDVLDPNICLAARNVPSLTVMRVDDLDPVSLLRHEHVGFTVGAIKQLEARLYGSH